MTTYRTTFLLALIFIGLGVYLYTIEVPTMKQETVQQRESQRLLPFDYRNVTEMTITTGGETIHLARDSRHRWRIVEPRQAKADTQEVEAILRALEIGKVSRVIQDSANNLNDYGLDTPNMTIQLTAQGQSETIKLGDVGPLSSTLYAQRLSDQQVLLTTLSVTDFRRKSLYTFRYKYVMVFNRSLVERIQLQSSEEQMTLNRVPSIHGLTGNWRFSTPFEGPADKTSVGLFLMALEDLSAVAFIDTQTEKEALLSRLPSPVLTATIHTGNHGHLVSLYQSSMDPNVAYAVTSADNPIYQISPGILRKLPKRAFDLQDKRLFGMEVAEIGLLSVTTPSGSYTVVQQHGEWYLDGAPDKPIDQKKMALFVSRVVGLPAELAISVSTDNLEEYGLATPAIEMVGIDTRGRPRGHLALGERGKGLVYAKGGGLPGVYQARSLILTQIPTVDSLEKP